MATSRVRHRGQPPRDVDHGPANGAGGAMTLGAHAQVARIAQADASKLIEVGGRMPDGGAGAIERSMATEAQRAAWRAAEEAAAVVRAPVKAKLEVDGAHAKGSPEERAAASKARQLDYRARQGIDRPAMGSPEHLHASRMRGAARHLEVVAARAEPRRSIAVLPSPVTPEEEPVMAIEPPRADPERIHVIITQLDALNAVQAALSEAIEIQSALDAARRAERDLAAAQKEAYEVLRAACRRAGLAELLDVFATPPARERVLVDEPALEEERQVTLEDAAVAAALRDGRLGDELVDDTPEVVTRRSETPVAAGGGSGTEAEPAAGSRSGVRTPARRRFQGDRRRGGLHASERAPGARRRGSEGTAAGRADRQAAGRLREVLGDLSVIVSVAPASHGRSLSAVHREAAASSTTLVNGDLSAAAPHCPPPFRTFVDAGCGQRPRQHEERPRHSRLLRPIEYSEASS